jgi:hypothetical protein
MKIFVIMPFSKTTEMHTSSYWTRFYKTINNIIISNQDVIKTLFNCDTLEVHRASAPQGNIVKSIIYDLKNSDVVITVLTDHNPNVLYELGIRHSQSNKTIILCQENQKIPFDLNNYGIGLYIENKLKNKRIEQEIMNRLKQIALNPEKSDNPFFEFMGNDFSMNNQQNHLEINIIEVKDGETYRNIPKFFREIERDQRGKIIYTGKTIVSFLLDLLNVSTNAITIRNTNLIIRTPEKECVTNQISAKTTVLTITSTVSIGASYKNKIKIEAQGHYQDFVTFIIEELIPLDYEEVEGVLEITDIFGGLQRSQPFKLMSYVEKEILSLKKLYGENYKEYLTTLELLSQK